MFLGDNMWFNVLKRELQGKNARRNRAIRRTMEFVENMELNVEFSVGEISEAIEMENMQSVVGRKLRELDNLEEMESNPRIYIRKW